MAPDDPDVEQLKHRQREQELAERDALAGADSEAEAEKHERRADKARYLREKLEQREQSEREARREDG
jgi:hypothetical protein